MTMFKAGYLSVGEKEMKTALEMAYASKYIGSHGITMTIRLPVFLLTFPISTTP